MHIRNYIWVYFIYDFTYNFTKKFETDKSLGLRGKFDILERNENFFRYLKIWS